LIFLNRGIYQRHKIWSSEYIENCVINETIKLVNRRCIDLGYVPFNQLGAEGSMKVKLWGPPYILNSALEKTSF
jgi:hypothetical protein